METLHKLLTSVTVEQWALVIGTITFLLHSVIDRNNNLAKPLNLFIVRATTVVVPIGTALAIDPSVAAIVHNYFPALLGFFTAYQGLYHLLKAIEAKVEQVKALTSTEQIV